MENKLRTCSWIQNASQTPPFPFHVGSWHEFAFTYPFFAWPEGKWVLDSSPGQGDETDFTLLAKGSGVAHSCTGAMLRRSCEWLPPSVPLGSFSPYAQSVSIESCLCVDFESNNQSAAENSGIACTQFVETRVDHVISRVFAKGAVDGKSENKAGPADLEECASSIFGFMARK
jgi:hypothetical protein